MDPGWVTAVIALVTIVAAIGGWVLRRIWRVFRRTDRFLEDWNGVPGDTHGHPARPGVLERLAGVEHVTERILHEVTLNSGMSVKDVVTRTETAVADMQKRVDSIARQVENLPGGAK